jgi:hypothetical protein
MFPHKFENLNMRAGKIDTHPTSGCWPVFKTKLHFSKQSSFLKQTRNWNPKGAFPPTKPSHDALL